MLATAVAGYFLLQPYGSLALAAEEASALGMFVAEMCVTAALVVAMVESRVSAQRREAQLRRLNKAHRALGVANEALVRAKDDAMLLEDICRAIVEVAGYRMCWVGRAERDAAKTVRPLARAGYDDGFVDRAEVTWADVARGRGAMGTAIRTERPCVLGDIATDSAFAPWREEALRRGYASVIAVPLCADGQVMGALAIYASEKDAFDADAVKLLSDLGNDLAYGLAALRARAAVVAERACFEAAVMQAPVAIALYTGPDDVVRIANRRWHGLGIPVDAIGRPRKVSLSAPARERILPVLADVHETGEPREMKQMPIPRVRPDGTIQERFFNIAYQPLSAPNGVVTDIIAAVSDVSEPVLARRAGEEARAAAERANRAKDAAPPHGVARAAHAAHADPGLRGGPREEARGPARRAAPRPRRDPPERARGGAARRRADRRLGDRRRRDAHGDGPRRFWGRSYGRASTRRGLPPARRTSRSTPPSRRTPPSGATWAAWPRRCAPSWRTR